MRRPWRLLLRHLEHSSALNRALFATFALLIYVALVLAPSIYIDDVSMGRSDPLSTSLRALLKKNNGLLLPPDDAIKTTRKQLAALRKETQHDLRELPNLDSTNDTTESKPPMDLNEIMTYLNDWIRLLHKTMAKKKRGTPEEIWQTFHNLTIKTLYPWDREYLKRMPPRRDDGSIFLSIASYRDENCLNTISWAYAKAKQPEKLYVGLVQQNCEDNCKSGILEGGNKIDVEPDQDCHKAFCESSQGKRHCEAGRVRALHIDENESLGPYAARYFASKLWYGEQWYMQTDAHMTFLQDWDAVSINMLNAAPSKKPVSIWGAKRNNTFVGVSDYFFVVISCNRRF